MTHFEVLGFGLEGQIFGLEACLENALLSAENIELLKMIHGHELFSLYLGNWHFLARRPFFSFWRTPAACVLGLEHSCPRPREVSSWP